MTAQDQKEKGAVRTQRPNFFRQADRPVTTKVGLVVLLTPAVSAIVIAIVIAIMSVMPSLVGDEVRTSELRSLNSIDSVFPLAECMQLFHFVLSKARRQ